MTRPDPYLLLARAAVGAGRLVARLLPGPLRRRIDDRVFGAIFQVTRVTNDAYGWRPDTPPGPDPERP